MTYLTGVEVRSFSVERTGTGSSRNASGIGIPQGHRGDGVLRASVSETTRKRVGVEEDCVEVSVI